MGALLITGTTSGGSEARVLGTVKPPHRGFQPHRPLSHQFSKYPREDEGRKMLTGQQNGIKHFANEIVTSFSAVPNP